MTFTRPMGYALTAIAVVLTLSTNWDPFITLSTGNKLLAVLGLVIAIVCIHIFTDSKAVGRSGPQLGGLIFGWIIGLAVFIGTIVTNSNVPA